MSRSGPGPLLPAVWCWWEDGAHDGVTNMAVDEALRASARAGKGTWRWYRWATPTVSFGRNERLAGRVTPARLAATGLDAVRRPTGGRALLHHRELTYSVTMTLPAPVPWRAAYDAVNAILLDGLRRAGVHAAPAPDARPVAPDGPVCFDQPSAGELTVHGRKLVGSAVWRQGECYLQHGSILLHDDQPLLQSLADDGAASPAAATLASCFPGEPDDAVAQRVLGAMRAALDGAMPGERHARPRDAAADAGWADLVAAHHRQLADPRWLWRR